MELDISSSEVQGKTPTIKTKLEIVLAASIALIESRKAEREIAESKCLKFPEVRDDR